MVEVREREAFLLWFPTVPAGPIPPAQDPDGCYPYPTMVETARRPEVRRVTMLVIENELVRAEICPDLGGRVFSLIHRPSGRECLYAEPVVRPIRILPRQAFTSGGIEVSFPISHTPVQIEAVKWELRQEGGRAFVYVGEREVKFGMHWTVEFSLGDGEPFLTERPFFQNPGTESHPWMSWSNASLVGRPDTEFHYPNGPVLEHRSVARELDWERDGARRQKDVSRMTGWFWKKPDAQAFGAFTPSLGRGLYHAAEVATVPGMKLWTYGLGPHEVWPAQASLTGASYIEIQAGPQADQSVKEWLLPGAGHAHVETWWPTDRPLDIRALAPPAPALPPLNRVPRFDWARPHEVGIWEAVATAWKADNASALPDPTGPEDIRWAPSGMERLGEALRWAAGKAAGRARDRWLFHLGSWLAGREETEPALEALTASRDDRARALAGRLHRRREDPVAAAASFRSIESDIIALHPQVVVERDQALAALGPETQEERGKWMDAVAGLEDEGVAERRAALLLDRGRPADALRVLESARFQLVHQRSIRSKLWVTAMKQLGETPREIPAWLGEDDLAEFGAYREHREV